MTYLSAMALEEEAKMALFQSIVGCSDKQAFARHLDDFEWKCNRRKN